MYRSFMPYGIEQVTPGERGQMWYPVSEPGYDVPTFDVVPSGGTPVVFTSECGPGVRLGYFGPPAPPLPPPWVLFGTYRAVPGEAGVPDTNAAAPRRTVARRLLLLR
jgi:hypothetical protein